MIIDAGLKIEYWAEAVSTAVHVMNRNPSSVTGNTPEFLFTGRKPNLRYLKVFGCKAMVHIPKEKRKSKWDEKSKERIFVGYCENTKGYRLMIQKPKKLRSAETLFSWKTVLYVQKKNP